MRKLELAGSKIGRLAVISPAEPKNGDSRWFCRCDCGRDVIIRTSTLRCRPRRANQITSCGCVRNEKTGARRRTHGVSSSVEYRLWEGIIRRCYQKSTPGYAKYGARGITMSPQWRHSFETFLRAMGLRPSPKMTIERNDNDGPYRKENCRWATSWEQQRNRQATIYTVVDGIEMAICDAAAIYGRSPSMVHSRLRRGWSIERALNTPAIDHHNAWRRASPTGDKGADCR
jgi:hypothetical protein